MAALTVVIVATVVACTALTVDIGSAWAAKRRLRTATDSAALASAHEYAKAGNGCSTVDDSHVTANDPAASVTGCTLVPEGGNGYHVYPGRVTVNAQRPVDFQFISVVGVGDTTVESSTTARFGTPSGATGLRPMGLCLNGNAQLSAWMNLAGGGPTADSGTIRIMYTKDQPDGCGANAPGNWGMMDFNGGSNSNAETKDWVLNGYPGLVQVTFGAPNVPGDTGAFSNSISGELSTLIDKEFGLPVFDQVTGNGANAMFRVVALAKVELIDFKTTGAQASRYLDLQFKLGSLPGGRCCNEGRDTGARSIDICAVDETYNPANCDGT